MTDPPPTIYLLYGDDEFAMTEFIRNLRNKLGDETTAEMNFVQFSATDLVWPDLIAAAKSMPFLSSRRLVVLDNVERFQKDTESLERLISLLEQLPPSTAFLLLERKSTSKSSSASKLRRWVEEHDSISFIRACETPHSSGFVTWLQDRASAEGGSIEYEAAVLLSEWVQEDPRLAAQELTKLLDYADRQRPIAVDDVEQCTPYRGQSNIFALVDAIGLRRGDEAQKKLHLVLQEQDPRKVFPMILRQFRLILRARELIDAGLPPDDSVHNSAFVVKKVAAQARNFTLADIENIYHELLAIDLRSKNGQMDLDVALDCLVVAITA